MSPGFRALNPAVSTFNYNLVIKRKHSHIEDDGIYHLKTLCLIRFALPFGDGGERATSFRSAAELVGIL